MSATDGTSILTAPYQTRLEELVVVDRNHLRLERRRMLWNAGLPHELTAAVLTCMPLISALWTLWVRGRPAWSTDWVPGQPRLHKRNPVSKTGKKIFLKHESEGAPEVPCLAEEPWQQMASERGVPLAGCLCPIPIYMVTELIRISGLFLFKKRAWSWKKRYIGRGTAGGKRSMVWLWLRCIV